jgi:predicted nuclease of predicted toxin-antitoxin system
VRLLLDEHLSPRIAVELRRRGPDIIAVGERADLRGALDEALWAAARREGRAFVTRDVRDFVRLAWSDAAIGRPHAGLVLVRPRAFRAGLRDVGRLAAALGSLLAAHPDQRALEGQVVWLEPIDEPDGPPAGPVGAPGA